MKHKDYIALLEAYRKGTISEADRHMLERAALDDPMLFDAMEGYAMSEDQDLSTHIEALKRKVTPTKTRKLIRPWMVAAASFLVLATIGLMMRDTLEEQSPTYAKSEEVDMRTAPAPMANKVETEAAEQEEMMVLTQEAQNESEDKHAFHEVDNATYPEAYSNTYKKMASNTKLPSKPKKEAEYTQSESAPEKIIEEKEAVEEAIDISQPGIEMADAAPTGGRVNMKSKARMADMESAQSDGEETNSDLIYGVIRDEDGLALIGARVAVENTDIEGTTDIDGRFSIPKYPAGHKLLFSYTGFESQEILIRDNQDEYNIVLVKYVDMSSVLVSKGLPFVYKDKAFPAMGMDDFEVWIRKEMKYPLDIFGVAKESKVKVSFNVNEDGSLSNFIDEEPYCDQCFEEAVRLLKASGKWETKPAGSRCRTSYTFKF